MPYKCCVVGCKGNYLYGPKVHVFSFPKKEELRHEWLCAISRKNFTPSKHTKVCERHFKENEIIKEATGYDDKTGKTISAPLQYVKLSPKAVPSRFLVFPSVGLSRIQRSSNKIRKNLNVNVLQQALKESLNSKTKLDCENHNLDNTFSDNSNVSKEKPDICKEMTLKEEEEISLPVITSVQSCTDDEEWMEEDFDQKVDNSDQENDNSELITDKFIWKHEALQLLIEHYRCYKELLKSVCMKKKDVWQKIAKSMQKQGYAVTAEMCEERWHNLFSTYKDCIENNRTIGCTARKWKYYEHFHELYWKDIVSILDMQTSEKLNVGVQTTFMSDQCSSLESEPTCSSTTSPSTPVFTDCNDISKSLSTQKNSNTETKDDPLLQFLREKHQSDIHWQLQMKELAFKNIKLQEQTNETLNRLTEILTKHIQEH